MATRSREIGSSEILYIPKVVSSWDCDNGKAFYCADVLIQQYGLTHFFCNLGQFDSGTEAFFAAQRAAKKLNHLQG